MQFPHQPMTLTRRAQPFSHPDWFFEIKHDGFRALAYVQAGQCQLFSRKGYVYKRFGELTEHIGAGVNVQSVVLDGEIVCLDKNGKSQFKSLMYQRGEAYFYAFDILQLDGRDLRSLPLHARKQKLKRLIPDQPSALLYVDHIEQHGERLFHLACREDLEGIVAKLRNGTYDCQHGTSWIKIKNPINFLPTSCTR
jgi:bifunctional non-homologous end joining protein LigD